MALAVVLVLLVIGSVIFHFWSPWWFTEVASNWGTIDDTIEITFWVTGLVFVALNIFVAVAIIKYRQKEGSRAYYEPENKKLEIGLTVFTTIGVALMLAPGLVVWAKFVNVPEGAAEVEVVGQQWYWSYRFPGEDGRFGTVDARLISPDNPFGMNPDDDNGQDDVLVMSQELHLPVNKPVKLLLRSKDVLHNYTVAQFRVKMDIVPGMVSYMWLTPTRTGTFDALCEELCGVAHFTMRGRVVVEEEDAYQAWLSSYPTYAETVATVKGNANAGQAMYAVCSACHGADGAGNLALNAPKLTGQHPWYLARQIKHYQNGARGALEEDNYGRQMAPMASTLVNDQAIANVVAYIDSLPDKPAPATMSGDIERGKELYTTCAACHAADGHGIWSQNGPRLAGMSDWYMSNQLRNFSRAVRGAHADDAYGVQMVLMAKMLRSEKDIADVIAYINTL
ncbi:MAG: c-type cytochrome [Gammaproteobacteria bacterium]|nr:c-type cytochrome [Gammaproteobacteria bacterium]